MVLGFVIFRRREHSNSGFADARSTLRAVQSPLQLFQSRRPIFAGNVDALFSFILMTTLFFAVLVTVLIIFAAFKFRRRARRKFGDDVHGNNLLEVDDADTDDHCNRMSPGARRLRELPDAPKDTLDIYVIGKQWMWKLQAAERAEGNQRAALPGEPRRKVDHGQRKT